MLMLMLLSLLLLRPPPPTCCCSEQQLAADIWPAPFNRHLFGQLAQPFLASLVAAGHDIVEARKAPDKV